MKHDCRHEEKNVCSRLTKICGKKYKGRIYLIPEAFVSIEYSLKNLSLSVCLSVCLSKVFKISRSRSAFLKNRPYCKSLS